MVCLEYRKIQGLAHEESFSVVIPKSYAVNLGISKGDVVRFRQEENRIIIEKVWGDKKMGITEAYHKIIIHALVGEQSFAVVLPKSFAVHLGIGKGDFVRVSQDEKKIIIEKAWGDKNERLRIGLCKNINSTF
jgi:bifunctional DNA-binding transcriptional regulator/antitoxin component of YhaV-PrlF toxin-antitoxin module